MHYSGAVYRPPSEARSLIVQCTLGCSHNKCAFCTMYKDKKFSINPIEQVLSDLDEARAYGRYIEKIFLADGDALILPMDYLLTVLDYIRDHFPTCKRVAAYATTKAIMRKTDDELRTLREHGLGIVYIGLESGNEELLKKFCKGVTAEEIVLNAIRCKQAGIATSVTAINGNYTQHPELLTTDYTNFAGCIGANNAQIGSLFGGWLEENASEDGSEGFLISTSLAAQGNTQHVEITRAILEGLQQKYGITYTKSIDDLIASSETTNVENDKNILITLYPGSPNKDTWLPGISTLLQTGNYKMFLSSGQTYNQSATVVDEVEKSFGINIKVASVGALGTTLETAFNTKDSSGNSSVDLVAIKAVSTQTAAMFAATYNALVSGAECRACRGEDGLPVYFTFNFIPITSAEQLTEMSGWDAKETGNWIANKDFVDQMLVTVNPDVTSDDINAIMQSLSYEKIKEMMG